MRTNVRETVRETVTSRVPSPGQTGKSADEQKARWGAAVSGKSNKPQIATNTPPVGPPPTPRNPAPNQTSSSASKGGRRTSWWSLVPIAVVLTAAAVFRKSIVASLVWAGGAVFLGILLVVCSIGFCLCVVWAINYWRHRKKSGAIYSVTFFVISCALAGVSAKYAFNMESNSPEYKQAIVKGVERNLTPHSEHLTVKFREQAHSAA